MVVRLRHAWLLLSIGLCGCVPIVDSYHSASASEGKDDVSCLKGNLGPPSRVDVDRGAVHLTVDGRELSGVTSAGLFDAGSLVINFTVPRGHRAALDWDQIAITDLGSNVQLPITYRDSTLLYDVIYQGRTQPADITPRDVNFVGIYADASGIYHHTSFLGRIFGGRNQFDFHIGDELDPDAVPRIQEDASQSDAAEYRLDVGFQGRSAPARFDLHLPEMQVDGQAYPALDVRFQHTVGFMCILVLPALNAPPLRGTP